MNIPLVSQFARSHTHLSGVPVGAAASASAAQTAISGSSRPPPSVADTEDTVVAPDTVSTPKKGRKRSRKDDDVPEERAVRPRDASYEPTQAENPGFLAWVSDSIKGFFRGFREGLSG